MFSTNENPDKSKTKCLVFTKKPRDRADILPVQLDNSPLPWVRQVKHLGNLLQVDNTMKLDIGNKRGKFIGKVTSILQEFHYVDPEILTKIMNIFTTSFYGSNLWDIFSPECEKLYKSWNVAIRQVYGVNRCTHRYFIETLSQSMHPKTMLCARYVAFYKSLISSSKVSVRFLARLFENDGRTVLGKTLSTLRRYSNVQSNDSLTPQIVKNKVKYFEVPDSEEWRIDMLTELLQLRRDSLTRPGFSQDEIQCVLDFVCTK